MRTQYLPVPIPGSCCLLDDGGGGGGLGGGGVTSTLFASEMNDIIGIRSIHLAGERLEREAGKQ